MNRKREDSPSVPAAKGLDETVAKWDPKSPRSIVLYPEPVDPALVSALKQAGCKVDQLQGVAVADAVRERLREYDLVIDISTKIEEWWPMGSGEFRKLDFFYAAAVHSSATPTPAAIQQKSGYLEFGWKPTSAEERVMQARTVREDEAKFRGEVLKAAEAALTRMAR